MTGPVLARAAIERKMPVSPVTLLDKRFDRFKPETVQEERKLDVKENEAMKLLMTTWKRYLQLNPMSLVGSSRVNKHFTEAIKIIHSEFGATPPTAKNIEAFVIMLKEFEDERCFNPMVGFFLSALIEISKNTEFTIHTSHLSIGIDCLGYYNTKKVHVVGNLGDSVAYHQGKTITADSTLVLTPEFVADGDVMHFAGRQIHAGKLIINGNARWKVGEFRSGGEIHLNGDYLILGQASQKIDIFHKGVQIERKGE